MEITAIYVTTATAADPEDPVWSKAPETIVNLNKRLNEVGARMSFEAHEERHISVKVIHNGTDIFFLYKWEENEANIACDYPVFPDAFAMQIPFLAGDSPLCMGALHQPVNIIFWRPDLQMPQNVVAGGSGTAQTSPDAASQNIRHSQSWADRVWRVIITRPMAAASENQVSFERGAIYKVAFANWKGGVDAERGGHKIVSDWLNLSIQ